MKRVRNEREIRAGQLRADIIARYPRIAARLAVKKSPPVPSPVFDPKALVLGRNEFGAPVILPELPRLEHSHIIGTTGGGKSNFLEHCIRQDIRNGFGVCVVDPHGNHPGSLYRSLLIWLEKKGYTKGGKNERTIHLIDPNAPTHSFCFNPLAMPDESYDPSVIAAATLDAIEQVWGGEDSDTKPTIQRVLIATFSALAELGLTLAEARLLYDPDDKSGLRALALRKLKDEVTREEIEWLHSMGQDPRGRQDFRAEVVGPRNRIGKIVRSLATRLIVAQTERSIDLREAMDERHIILVNLSAGNRAYKDATSMIGRLLTRFLFLNLDRRRKPELPYFFYLDECQRYLSGDIADMLAEARKYGLGVVLSHQWQSQLAAYEEETLSAVRNATNLKAVFRTRDAKESKELAEIVIPLSLEMPVQASIKPTVVGHRITRLKSETATQHAAEVNSYAEAAAETGAVGTATVDVSGFSSGAMSSEHLSADMGWTAVPTVLSTSAGLSSQESGSHADSSSVLHAKTYAETRGKALMAGQSVARGSTEALEPIYKDLPGSFHSLEHELYFAAQKLRQLSDGEAYVHFVGKGKAPAVYAKLTVPLVSKFSVSDDEYVGIRTKALEASPSARPIAEALAHMENRKKSLSQESRAHVRQTPEISEPKTWRVAAPKRKPKGRGREIRPRT